MARRGVPVYAKPLMLAGLGVVGLWAKRRRQPERQFTRVS